MWLLSRNLSLVGYKAQILGKYSKRKTTLYPISNTFIIYIYSTKLYQFVRYCKVSLKYSRTNAYFISLGEMKVKSFPSPLVAIHHYDKNANEDVDGVHINVQGTKRKMKDAISQKITKIKCLHDHIKAYIQC